MAKLEHFLLVATIQLLGCVGTDLLNEPAVLMPPRIVIAPNNSAVEVGNTTRFQALYYDSLGNQIANVAFHWTSSDHGIATIDANGQASGQQSGQVRIGAYARGIASAPAILTVVANPNQVARVVVTPDSSTIMVGGTQAFTATARNLNGNVLTDKIVSWRSSDATIARINSNGVALGNTKGRVYIIASVDGVDSPAIPLTVLGTARRGSFSRNPGTSYHVSGTATLVQQPNGRLLLNLGDDFSSSNGPGLEIFLAATNTVGANSLNLGRLQRTSGAQSYNIPAGVTLSTYHWVIIHCVPFNVTFGSASLQ